MSRALWITEPGRVELRSEAMPTPAGGERRARALVSGISRGTESLVLAGRVPASQHQTMRAPAMRGEFPFPVNYGYAWVGQFEDAPHERVFALAPHREHQCLGPEQYVRVPATLDDHEASLAANMETALNALWDAELDEGDRVTVIGAGVVGSLVALACMLVGPDGVDLELVDLDPEARTRALALGCTFATPDAAASKRTVIFNASGSGLALRRALELADFEGRVVEMSWFGDDDVSLPLGAHFHSQRLRIVCSQVGHVAPAQRAHHTHRQRLQAAIELLADAKAGPLRAQLLGDRLPIDAAPQRYAELIERPGLHHCITYD